MHYDTVGEYGSFGEAMECIRTLTGIPWNEEPNVAPCASGETCSRLYVINEYDTSTIRWKYISTTEPIVDISAKGVTWFNKDVKVYL